MDLMVTDLTDGSLFGASLTDEDLASSLFCCPDIVQRYSTDPAGTVALIEDADDIEGQFLFSADFEVVGFHPPEPPAAEQEQAEEELGDQQQHFSYLELLEAP